MRKGLGIVRWEWAGLNVVVEVSLAQEAVSEQD